MKTSVLAVVVSLFAISGWALAAQHGAEARFVDDGAHDEGR